MKNIFIITFAVLYVFLIGCSDNDNKCLESIENIMDAQPDSALTILKTIDASTLEDERCVAVYNLLMTEATIKNHIMLEDDSLIGMAHDYFMKHGDSFNYMKSSFYRARILYYAGNYSQAMALAISTYQLAEKSNDKYWLAKAADCIADLYSQGYQFDKAMPFHKEAIDLYREVHRIDNHRFALADMAFDIGNSGNYTNAILVLDSLLSIAGEDTKDIGLKGYCQGFLLDFLTETRQNSRALKVAKEMYDNRTLYSPSFKDYNKMAIAFARNGEADLYKECDAYLDTVAQTTSQKLMVSLSKLEALKNGVVRDSMLMFTDSILQLQNDFLSEMLQESVIKVESDYYNSVAETEKDEKHQAILVSVIIVLCLIITVNCLGYVFRTKYLAKKIELETQRDIAANLAEEAVIIKELNKDQKDKIEGLNTFLSQQKIEMEQLHRCIEENNRRMAAIKQDVQNLFLNRWETINALSKKYYNETDTDKAKKILAKQMDKEIMKLRDKDSIIGIESTVNYHMDDIVTKLRAQCAFLTDSDVAFITLIYARFSPRAVCLIMTLKLTSFYNKRSRLSKRILKSEAPDKQWFVDMMGAEQHSDCE